MRENVSIRRTDCDAQPDPEVEPFPRSSHAAAQRAFETVGLWSRRYDRLDTLSGGQQRWVLIARTPSIPVTSSTGTVSSDRASSEGTHVPVTVAEVPSVIGTCCGGGVGQERTR